MIKNTTVYIIAILSSFISGMGVERDVNYSYVFFIASLILGLYVLFKTYNYKEDMEYFLEQHEVREDLLSLIEDLSSGFQLDINIEKFNEVEFIASIKKYNEMQEFESDEYEELNLLNELEKLKEFYEEIGNLNKESIDDNIQKLMEAMEKADRLFKKDKSDSI